MWENIRDIILKLYNKITNKTDREAKDHQADTIDYEKVTGVNLMALVSNKLATLTVTESNINVIPESQNPTKRTEKLNEIAQSMWDNAQEITARAFGTGGVLLLPYAVGGKIYTDIVPRDKFFITSSQGTDIKEASILADVITRKNDTYYRFTDYSIEDNNYVIRNKAIKNHSNTQIPLNTITEWQGIDEEIRIANVDKMLFAYLKSPFNRGRTDNLYGTPITKGSEDIIKQIEDCLNDVYTEFKNKKLKIFVESSLFDKDTKLSADIYKKTQGGGKIEGGAFFEIFDPAFRETAYYTRLNALFELLEKSIGTSRGILTEPTTTGATATEIKRSTYDTYALITNMRHQWEKAANDLVYAYDVLCNYYGLTPKSDYSIEWDWSYSMIESSAESWAQMKDAQAMGIVKKAEARQWLNPSETLEEAQSVIDEITASEPNLESLMPFGDEGIQRHIQR
ncbi:MAG: phage portal protein [Oscillospiraceae bacterium]